MSYQFEDDSALEELLNQQLDRRRQQTLGGRATTTSSSGNRTAQSIRPASSRISNDVGQSQSGNTSLPSQVEQQSAAAPRGKLGSWLAAPSSSSASSSPTTVLAAAAPAAVERTQAARKSSIPNAVRQEAGAIVRSAKSSAADLIPYDEERLQQMSKQRLIQLILEDIQPNVRESIELAEAKLRHKVDRLNVELDEERGRHQLRERQQIELMECKWQQLNKQLEARLESSESELKQTREGQKSLISELDEEFKRQTRQLSENYQLRLDEEKRSNADALRRSQELHQLELESKLKVNVELDKLEKTFGEWQRMVRATVTDLGEQLKTIEALLERQTLEVNTTNVNLTKKSQQLSEQYAKFESRTSQLDALSANLSDDLLPQLSKAQHESQSALDKINGQLQQLTRQSESLDRLKLELEQQKQQLDSGKAQLDKDKFELALELNRLAFKEEKLADLVGQNERIESELTEQRTVARQKELKVESMETSLESKSKKLREQNYELHLIRKRLAAKEENLGKVEVGLNERAGRLNEEEIRLKDTRRRLDEMSNKIRRESSQLCRLQKSLICSLCFERLFANQPAESVQQPAQVLANSRDFHQQQQQQQQQRHLRANQTINSSLVVSQRHCKNHLDNTADLELAALSDYFEKDAKELESECKYVQMLPPN